MGPTVNTASMASNIRMTESLVTLQDRNRELYGSNFGTPLHHLSELLTKYENNYTDRHQQFTTELHKAADAKDGQVSKSVSARLRQGRHAERDFLKDSARRPVHTSRTGEKILTSYRLPENNRGYEHGDDALQSVARACERDGVLRINEMSRRVEGAALIQGSAAPAPMRNVVRQPRGTAYQLGDYKAKWG